MGSRERRKTYLPLWAVPEGLERSAEAFWLYVDRSGGPEACWPWTRAKTRGGYGHMSVNGVDVRVHRYAWRLVNGPIRRGLFVCHKCDNPPCCNPRHLFLGTHTDNMRDGVSRARLGKLTAEQVQSIRAALAEGAGVRALARQYGVDHSAVSRINTGRHWTSLPKEEVA